jgi:hypothetical protein
MLLLSLLQPIQGRADRERPQTGAAKKIRPQEVDHGLSLPPHGRMRRR